MMRRFLFLVTACFLSNAAMASVSETERNAAATKIATAQAEAINRSVRNSRITLISDGMTNAASLVQFYKSPKHLAALGLIPDTTAQQLSIGPSISLISAFTGLATTKQVVEANKIMEEFFNNTLGSVQLHNSVADFFSKRSPANSAVEFIEQQKKKMGN